MPLVDSVGDAKLQLTYIGDIALQITRIEIREMTLYRFTRLTGYLIFFLFDVCYIILFTDIIAVYKKKKYVLFSLVFIWFGASVLSLGANLYSGHDIGFHIDRIVAIAYELRYGQFPVRIYSHELNDYGYLSSVFYGDIFLYFLAVLYLLKALIGICYQIYILTVNAITIWFSFYCFKKIVHDDKLALLGTLLYTLSPYRLACIYTRAAVGEYTAMIFLPLVLVGVYHIYYLEQWTKRDIFPLVIGISGVMQSHMITTEMTLLFCVLTAILEWKKTFTYSRLLILLKSGMWICLINTGFLIPFIWSSHMPIAVFGNEVTEKIQSHGLYFRNIFSILVPARGGSAQGQTAGDMALSVGGGLTVGFFLCLFCYR